MKLYLIRHAEARSEEEDPERDLTEEGVRTVQKMAGYLQNPEVAVIWHSGKKRAGHTAEILSGCFRSSGGVEVHSGLSPNDDVRKTADELSGRTDDTAIVGHLPFLSRLASLLLTGRRKSEVVEFTCGSVLCMEREEEDWRIRWFLTPEALA
jgi:phosphohistidine phosphatase